MIPQTPSDSALIVNLQSQVDSLTAQMNDIGIGTEYFESILSHQQLLFTLLAGIFTVVVLAGLGVSYGWYFRRVENQLVELKKQTTAAGSLVGDVTEMKRDVLNINIDVRRALWEGSPPYKHMKIIWHIRYCEAFLRHGYDGFLDDVNFHFVGSKAKSNIETEYHIVKNDSQFEFYQFINFSNIGGVKRILRSVLELAHDPKYKQMRTIAAEILSDIEKGFEHPNAKSSKEK